MKKITLSLVALMTSFSMYLSAQQKAELSTTKPGAEPSFAWIKTTEHDFGKIAKGTPVETTFEFTNSGKSPLVISDVKSSCGCTTPDYSKQPIAPGQKGFVKATFNAASVGVFNKNITINSNANEKSTVLTIKGEVIEKDSTTE